MAEYEKLIEKCVSAEETIKSTIGTIYYDKIVSHAQATRIDKELALNFAANLLNKEFASADEIGSFFNRLLSELRGQLLRPKGRSLSFQLSLRSWFSMRRLNKSRTDDNRLVDFRISSPYRADFISLLSEQPRSVSLNIPHRMFQDMHCCINQRLYGGI